MRYVKKLVDLIIVGLFIVGFLSTLPNLGAHEPVDDEKEFAYDCIGGQTKGIACEEGTIDCSPRDCTSC